MRQLLLCGCRARPHAARSPNQEPPRQDSHDRGAGGRGLARAVRRRRWPTRSPTSRTATSGCRRRTARGSTSVTSTGGYSDVTQADDGTMVGLTGVRLHKLTARATCSPTSTRRSATRARGPAKAFYGPYDPAISPDGKKVAYTYYYISQSRARLLPADVRDHGQGGRHRLLAGRPADRLGRGRARQALRLAHPSWIDNETMMLSDPTHVLNQDVVLDTVSDGPQPPRLVQRHHERQRRRPDGPRRDDSPAHEARLPRRGRRHTAADLQGAAVPARRLGSSLTDEELPYICAFYDKPAGGRLGSPSWSPDGTRLAYHDGEGLKTVTIPDWPGDECTATA